MSRSKSKAARDLLLGMKELPEQGGGWGLLLRRGAEPAELSPNAHGAVQALSPAYIEFVPRAMVRSRRGVLLWPHVLVSKSLCGWWEARFCAPRKQP